MNLPDPPPVAAEAPWLARMRAWDWVACAVLAASLAFRLAFFDHARFAGDEASQYDLVRRIGDLQAFPVQGTLTTIAEGAHIPGGAYFWILGIPQLAFHSPEASMALIVLLAVAGLAGGYVMFRREFGPPAALGALALAAFNPFHLFHGDRIWNPNLMPAIGFAFLALLVAVARGRGRRPAFWLGALLIAAPQIHLTGVLLIVLAAALLAVVRPAGFRWRQLLWGCVAGAATYLPYLFVEIGNGFANTRLLLSGAAASTAPVIESLRAVYYQVLYAAGDMTYFVAKGSAFPMTEWGFLGGGSGRKLMADFLEWDTLPGMLLVAGLAIGVVLSLAATLWLLGGTLVAMARQRADAVRRDPLAFLVLANLPLISAFFWGRKLFFPHYTIAMFPLALVPIAWALSRLRRPRLQVAVLVVLGLVAATQGMLSARNYLREEAKTSVPVYREVARTILSDSPGRAVAFECALPRTQCSSYPAHVLAVRERGGDFAEDRNADRRYILTPPGEEFTRGATRVWDVGPIWLVRRDRR